MGGDRGYHRPFVPSSFVSFFPSFPLIPSPSPFSPPLPDFGFAVLGWGSAPQSTSCGPCSNPIYSRPTTRHASLPFITPSLTSYQYTFSPLSPTFSPNLVPSLHCSSPTPAYPPSLNPFPPSLPPPFPPQTTPPLSLPTPATDPAHPAPSVASFRTSVRELKRKGISVESHIFAHPLQNALKNDVMTIPSWTQQSVLTGTLLMIFDLMIFYGDDGWMVVDN